MWLSYKKMFCSVRPCWTGLTTEINYSLIDDSCFVFPSLKHNFGNVGVYRETPAVWSSACFYLILERGRADSPPLEEASLW